MFLLRHRGDAMFFKTVEHVWYSSSPTTGSGLISDVQALLTVGDDLLSSKHEVSSSKQDATAVVNIGSNIRIERLDMATLVVVTQPPHTCISCQQLISSCTNVLKNCELKLLLSSPPTSSPTVWTTTTPDRMRFWAHKFLVLLTC